MLHKFLRQLRSALLLLLLMLLIFSRFFDFGCTAMRKFAAENRLSFFITAMRESRLIFITGTDTGVGKTVLSAMLLSHLRAGGCHALGLKPFCSGARADVDLLRAVQARELTREEINPFYFPEPVAPLVAARRHRRKIKLADVLTHVTHVARLCECLVIEGAGGLLVPLGSDFTTLELITRLGCEVIIVSRNKLGTINHTLLTVQALRQHRHTSSKSVKLVLMSGQSWDLSCNSNPHVLAEFLPSVQIFTLPFLGRNCSAPGAIKSAAKKMKKTLARLLQ